MRAQALRNRKSRAGQIRPHSLGSRAIQAMRDRGDWVSTAELVELTNRHRPERCALATRANVYEALSAWRKKGTIESRPIARGSQTLEWRVTK
jgi:hypothetical protein